MGLEDGDDPAGTGLCGRERRPQFLAVVGVVVHDTDARSGNAYHLEAPGHARKIRQQTRHLVRIDPQLDRHHGGGRGVLEVVQAGLGNVEGHDARGQPQAFRAPDRGPRC